MKLLCNVIGLLLMLIVITGCGEETVNEKVETTIFPKPFEGYVGDPMPSFIDGQVAMFYLHDARDGLPAFHPYNLMTTTNFYQWEQYDTVIPYELDLQSQDLALGTGSVVQSYDGTYHAFYTGHNYTGNVTYKEKVQHAISKNLLDWEKISEDGFYGDCDDFRDPYVTYIEDYQEYWMLVTTRVQDVAVLKKYTSTDLKNWIDEGVFFINPLDNNNMECPTLIQYKGYWYLTYSAQGIGNQRILRYSYKNSLEDNWITPDNNYIDGIGFYAGRLFLVEDRLFASGWVGTKAFDYNGGEYEWAGNLVNHELIQSKDGRLLPIMIREVDQLLTQAKDMEINNELGSRYSDNEITFKGEKEYEAVIFEAYDGQALKVEMNLDTLNIEAFGFAFDVDEIYGSVNIHFDIAEGRVEFYGKSTERIGEIDPQYFIEYDFPEYIEIKAVIQEECMIFYINQEIAFTARVYDCVERKFAIYSKSEESYKMNNVVFSIE